MIIGQSGRFMTPLRLASALMRLNIFKDVVERGSHQLVHLLRITALDKVGRVAVAAEKLIQLFMTDAGQHTRVGDLVAVQVQDREHHTVSRGD